MLRIIKATPGMPSYPTSVNPPILGVVYSEQLPSNIIYSLVQVRKAADRAEDLAGVWGKYLFSILGNAVNACRIVEQNFDSPSRCKYCSRLKLKQAQIM